MVLRQTFVHLFITLSIVGLFAILHGWNTATPIDVGLAVSILKQNWPWRSQEALFGVVRVSKLFLFSSYN
jgi:hypothetical protein